MYYRGRHHRISPIELLVLKILKEKPLYGNEIINELKTKFADTSFHAKSGTIYPILKKFKHRNWIEEISGADQYKKKYSLTDEGEKRLEGIFDNDVLDGFLGFYHKFSDFFFTDILGSPAPPSLKSIIHIKKQIKRLERRKNFLETNLEKINKLIEDKKEKLKKLEEEVEFHDIPIE